MSNVIWMLFERVVVTLAVLASNIYVVRSLGADRFGELSYIQAIFGLIVVAADCGLRRVMMVSFGRTSPGTIVSAMVFIKSIAAMLLCLFCYLAFLRNDNEGFIFIMLFCVFSPFEVYVFVLQAELRNDLLAKIRTLIALAAAGARVWLCLTDYGTVNLLLLTYIWQSSIIFLLAWVWKVFDKEKIWHISFRRFSRVWNISKIVFSKSVFFFISMILIQAHYRIDQIMISKISGDAELGIYSSAYKLVEQLLIVPGIISAVLLPTLALSRKNSELTKERLTTIYATTIFASVAIALPVMFLAEPLIFLAFGAEFIAAGNILFYLMMGLPFLFLANMSGLYFSVFGLERQAFLRNLVGLVFNVGLNFFMIPLFGAKGAALSTVVSYFMVAVGADVVFWARFKEHLDIKWMAVKILFTTKFYIGLTHVLRGR